MSRWWLVVAFVLAVVGGSDAQPPAEGAWGYAVPPAVGMSGGPFVGVARARVAESVDTAGITTFRLQFKDEEVVVLARPGKFADAIAGAERVRVIVERVELQRLGR